ncbi:hypothetical protein TorRG33x02_275320 [Trema orientale]|uniref:Uncharacterized protein n=1 Tax=Trema orientale TaxID=63057 RepID=A0A2P5CS35_TREOI|nr:hypothetical protein TorRG33x02_275320 [Trema orientale]
MSMSKLGKGKLLLWTSFIEIPEIYADSYLPILFPHWHNVNQPHRVFVGLNKSCLYQLLQFFLDLNLNVIIEVPGSLRHRFHSRVDNLLCVISFVLSPGISSYVQANTSLYSFSS